MNSVTVGVPAYGLPGAAVLPFSIHTESGDGAIFIKNIECVTERVKLSVRRIIDVCKALTHTKLNPHTDLTIESERLLEALVGESWELPIALGMLSLFTGRPLKSGLTATGALLEGDYTGRLSPVAGLSEKIGAAKNAGLTTFLLPDSQAGSAVIVQGVTVIPVADLRHAWEIASGIPLWRATW